MVFGEFAVWGLGFGGLLLRMTDNIDASLSGVFSVLEGSYHFLDVVLIHLNNKPQNAANLK